jgi:hypothetical protein
MVTRWWVQILSYNRFVPIFKNANSLQLFNSTIKICGFSYSKHCLTHPTNFLMDSTMSPKVKITEGKKVEVCYLVRNTSRVKGCAGVPGWD